MNTLFDVGKLPRRPRPAAEIQHMAEAPVIPECVGETVWGKGPDRATSRGRVYLPSASAQAGRGSAGAAAVSRFFRVTDRRTSSLWGGA